MVHQPTPVRWTFVPRTVQRPRARNTTRRPEDARALTRKLAAPRILFGNRRNVIRWLALAILSVCATSLAEAYVASPGCDAVTVHEPVPVMWTVVPLTMHFPLAAKVTVSFDE